MRANNASPAVPDAPETDTPALLVVLAGVSAALHVGKLPPALPVLREALHITLVQAGFLLSLVQVAGMCLGLVAGLLADGLGLRRCMLTGLVLLSAASALGGWAQDAATLLVLRTVEGCGFLLAAMPGPSLLRRLVPPARLSRLLGVWGAYMPAGTALSLLLGPAAIGAFGWRTWWWWLAAASLAMALCLWRRVPADPARSTSAAPHWRQRLRRTLTAPGPWGVGLSFCMYAGQWLAVIGFLPSIYAQAGLAPGLTGVLTALASAINIVGNLCAGRLLHQGVRAERLLLTGFITMALTALLAFAPVLGGQLLPLAGRYAAVLVFSMVGGIIPVTLFALAVRLAPDAGTVSTTIGLMQQCLALGQVAVPPLAGWAAARAGDWHWTWAVTSTCSLLGLLLAWRLRRLASPILEKG